MEDNLKKEIDALERYEPVFAYHYVCAVCTREIKTSACKKPTRCPFCENLEMRLLGGG